MALQAERPDPAELLPLRPADMQILLVLSEGDRHGYGVMKDVEEQSGGKVTLELGSLYRLIGRLLDQGLIEDAGERPASETDSRVRRYYRITSLGREVLEAEVQRLAEIVETARAREGVGS